MKQNLFFLAVLMLMGFAAKSQCNPNLSYTGPGFYTNDGDSTLDLAYLNATYLENVSLYVPRQYDFSGFLVNVDSVRITDIQGLPDGIGSICNPTSCFWQGGDTGCIALSGIPSNPAQVGENQLTIKMTFHGLGFSRNEDVRIFKLTVLDTSQSTSIASHLRETTDAVVFPNPAKDYLNISFKSQNQNMRSIKLLELNGSNVLSREIYTDKAELQLDIRTVASGMYLLHIQEGQHIESKRIAIYH